LLTSFARMVECVVFACSLTVGLWYLNNLCCKTKYGTVFIINRGLFDNSESGSIQLIIMAGVADQCGWMVRDREDRMWDGGHRVKARRKVVQSSLGLWALSQLVPRIRSCVPTAVT
jgi:hypothetical protein